MTAPDINYPPLQLHYDEAETALSPAEARLATAAHIPGGHGPVDMDWSRAGEELPLKMPKN